MNIDPAYLFFSAAILSLVAFGDILYKYTGSQKLKWALLLLVMGNAGVAFINYLPEKTIAALLVEIFSKICMATAMLNILIFFHFSKKLKWINLLPALWVVLLIVTLFTNLNNLPNALDADRNTKIFMRPYYKELGMSNLISILRFSGLSVFLFIFFYFSLQLIKQFTSYQNLFAKRLRNWMFLMLFIMFLVLMQNVIVMIGFYKSIEIWTSIIVFHFIPLVFLYRPEFINRTYFNKTYFEITKESEKPFGFNEDSFINEFYNKAYFLNQDATQKAFSEILNISQFDLHRFINIKFNCGFNDLVQQKRIEFYLELISKKENRAFTIEALAKEVGFKSRTTFYNAFKKFHGGLPSDIANIS